MRTYRLSTKMLSYRGSPEQYFSDAEENKKDSLGIAIFYLLAATIIYIKLPRIRPILLTMIFSVFSLFILNTYMGRYFPDHQAGPSRYLYLPSIWLSIFWALFLWAAFWKTKGKLVILGYVVLLAYFLINSSGTSSPYFLGRSLFYFSFQLYL